MTFWVLWLQQLFAAGRCKVAAMMSYTYSKTFVIIIIIIIIVIIIINFSRLEDTTYVRWYICLIKMYAIFFLIVLPLH